VILNQNSNQNKAVFLVVGSDTGVGKTVFSGLLGGYISNIGLRFPLVKPFCSGGTKDIEFLKAANCYDPPSKVNYWYDDEPISPAAWELSSGDKINFDDIVQELRQVCKSDNFDIMLIEGVGGLLAPITQKLTVASLGKEFGANLIIIAKNRVGVINHVLLTVEAALNRGLLVVSVILMEQEEPDTSSTYNAELIRMHLPKMLNFKGVFEFPFLGKDADNPELISINVKKVEIILEKIFDEVINPFVLLDSNN
tara:strand:- start:103 stop:861 length:759 start_codon:yes stop_codon:yes gene_type:complete